METGNDTLWAYLLLDVPRPMSRLFFGVSPLRHLPSRREYNYYKFRSRGGWIIIFVVEKCIGKPLYDALRAETYPLLRRATPS